MTTIERHIRCWERDPNQPNAYETSWEAFHITFYEALSIFRPETTRNLPRGSWHYGPLYGSDEFDLCESALTARN
jgi:hypothetical protein